MWHAVQHHSDDKSTHFLSSQQVHDNVTLLPRQRRRCWFNWIDGTMRDDSWEQWHSQANRGRIPERKEKQFIWGEKGKERVCRLCPWRWRWSQKISHRNRGRLTPYQIITHSDEEENEIDLNVLSGDLPAVARWCILHAERCFMLNRIFYCSTSEVKPEGK